MPEIDIRQVEDRLNSLECSQAIRELVDALRKAAEQVGPVSWHAHEGAGSGWGLTAK